jgi:hypothetical protein
MAYERQFGAVSGTQNNTRASFVCQFLIDTLPIRNVLKSFASNKWSRSNRHSSRASDVRKKRQRRVDSTLSITPKVAR